MTKGLPADSDGWYEAKHHHMSVLARVKTRPRPGGAFEQFKALRPGTRPAALKDKFKPNWNSPQGLTRCEKPLNPTAAFPRRAGPAIARAGGINPASLARLRAIAQKHGMSASQMSAAIKQLGRGKRSAAKSSIKATPTPPAKPKLASKPKAFARFVREVLGPETALLPHQYDELTELAQTDYGLDSADAARVMEDVLRERGGEYLPPETAADALFERARELQASGRLDVAAFGRLQTAADQAGLSREQFQEILDRAAKAGTPIPDSLYGQDEVLGPPPPRSLVARLLAGAFVLFVLTGAGSWLRLFPQRHPGAKPEPAPLSHNNQPAQPRRTPTRFRSRGATPGWPRPSNRR